MGKKRRRRYKLLVPEPIPPALPPRVLAVATVVQWACACLLAGVLVAFVLISSLFTSFRPGMGVWLDLWPASLRLMTSSGLSPHQTTQLALWLAVENGLLYGAIGVGLGILHVAARSLRRRCA